MSNVAPATFNNNAQAKALTHVADGLAQQSYEKSRRADLPYAVKLATMAGDTYQAAASAASDPTVALGIANNAGDSAMIAYEGPARGNVRDLASAHRFAQAAAFAYGQATALAKTSNEANRIGRDAAHRAEALGSSENLQDAALLTEATNKAYQRAVELPAPSKQHFRIWNPLTWF